MHCVGSVFLKIWIDPTSHAFEFLTQLEAFEKDLILKLNGGLGTGMGQPGRF